MPHGNGDRWGDKVGVMPRAAGPMLYPQRYIWLVFVSALDVMLTWIVLHRGGREVNALADAIIKRFDIIGLVLFKFVIVAGVILICEVAGRRKPEAGRRLAEWGIAITSIPVIWSFVLLLTRG